MYGNRRALPVVRRRIPPQASPYSMP